MMMDPRIVELVLVVSKLSIMITVILINSPGVILVSRR